MNEDWDAFIKKSKDNYYKIGQVSCHIFPNEKIHFNKHGFNHVTFKNGVPRPRREQKERISLLPYVKSILEKAEYICDYREVTMKNSKAIFWGIRGSSEGKKLRIVIRKRNNGVLHFFSVMED